MTLTASPMKENLVVLLADPDVHYLASMDMNMDKLEFAAAHPGTGYANMYASLSNPIQALLCARTGAQPIIMAGSNTPVRTRSTQRVPQGQASAAHMQWS